MATQKERNEADSRVLAARASMGRGPGELQACMQRMELRGRIKGLKRRRENRFAEIRELEQKLRDLGGDV